MRRTLLVRMPLASAGFLSKFTGCGNHRNVVPVDDLSHEPDEHELILHHAIETLDCATVCRMLCSGMRLCYLGEESCMSLIVKHWRPASVNFALKLCPSAVNCRGLKGKTLLMMCESPEKFQAVLDHGADVNSTNDDGENVLIYNIKHRLRLQVHEILKHYVIREKVRMKNVVQNFKGIMRLILNSGVDLETEDNEGQTALQRMLQVFKPGYVFQQCYYERDKMIHSEMTCSYGNKIASFVLSLLLEAGARLPPPDQQGRTPLMLAAQSPWNFKNVRTLVERGVDMNAFDVHGNNAIYYLLASAVEHQLIAKLVDFLGWCNYKLDVVDQMVSFLLDHGCHMQGTNLLISQYCQPYKLINYLMAMETSTLRDRDFHQKQEVKNDPINVSFLGVYLKDRGINYNLAFKPSDVTFLEQEIAHGLDVNCGDHEYAVPSKEAEVWKERLSLPFPLLCTMDSKLQYYETYISSEPDSEDEGEDNLIEELQEQYQTIEEIQKLLLPFWPYPPLALLLFDQPDKDDPNHEALILLLKRLIQFLYEVGGPLSRGSEIYYAVKERLAANTKERPAYGELVSLFDQLHSEMPSLLQLSRTALRASLKKTDTKGLDVSSLRVLCEGEMRPLPPEIVEYINFKKSSVSAMQVVPEMIYYI